MRREIEAFMDYVMFEQDGSLDALFSGTRAYVNAPLAKIYGVTGPATADDWAWVDLDPAKRAGMLTRAGFLAVHASQSATSPIRRGVYMLKEVLWLRLAVASRQRRQLTDRGDERRRRRRRHHRA